MSARRRDDWDDWDDDDEVVTKKVKPVPRGESRLTTRRILIGLAVVAVAALVIGNLLTREAMQLTEVPPLLVGTWTCVDPEHSDLWVEFRPEWVTFGTGGTGRNKCRVLGVNEDPMGEARRFTVLYSDMARTEHLTELLVDASGDSLRFTDRPNLRYTRYR